MSSYIANTNNTDTASDRTPAFTSPMLSVLGGQPSRVDTPAPSDLDENVHAETNSAEQDQPKLPTDPEGLRTAALKEAADLNNALKDIKQDAAQRTDRQGWELVRILMTLLETFDRPEGGMNDKAYDALVKKHTKNGKVHGNVSNDYQPLVKACTPSGTKGPLITKLAKVIAALRKRDVRADAVMEELRKKEAVGDDGAERTGMERFVLLYKEDNPSAGSAPAAAPKFEKFDAERLKLHAKAAFAELKRRGIDPEEFLRSEPASV